VYIEKYNVTSVRLYITDIQHTDSGLYTCEVTVDGKNYREETRMFLYEDIKFEDTPTFVQHDLGSSPLLECQATGQPQPEITWRFNRRKITPDKDKYVIWYERSAYQQA